MKMAATSAIDNVGVVERWARAGVGLGKEGYKKEQEELCSRLSPSSEPSSENTDTGRRHGGEGHEEEEEEEEEEGRATTFVYTYFLYSRKFWNEIRMRGRSSFFLSEGGAPFFFLFLQHAVRTCFTRHVCVCVCVCVYSSPLQPSLSSPLFSELVLYTRSLLTTRCLFCLYTRSLFPPTTQPFQSTTS